MQLWAISLQVDGKNLSKGRGVYVVYGAADMTPRAERKMVERMELG